METLVWDGSLRVASFFEDFFSTDRTEYIQSAAKNFWVGMVARIYNPGCQVDNMIVLEGVEGVGKTSSLRAIGGKWYVCPVDPITSKDFFQALHGKMLVEFGEVEAMRGAEVRRGNQIITNTTDRYRSW